MKHSLLLVAVVALVAFAAPAHSQYMWLDTNNDGICDVNDQLSPSSTSVDVWLSTNTNGDGSPAVCAIDPGSSLTMNSYEFFVRVTSGSVTLGAWSDNLAYPTSFGDFQAGTDAYHGRAGAQQAPGTYKLGTLAISGVAAGSTLSIVSASTVNPPGFTSFGSNCPGADFDNTMKLGLDWNDVCGTASPTPVKSTTWGNIKNIYR